MKKKLLAVLLFLIACGIPAITYAQKDGFVFAITNLTKTGNGWDALRRLDLKTGEFSTVLFNGSDAKVEAYDGNTQRKYKATDFTKRVKGPAAPFGTGVAATAFDQKNNRLYFTPTAIDQLRFVDLNSMKLYYVADQPLTGLGNTLKNEGAMITRMTIAPDGNGYAISNDGNSFVKFTIGATTEITQLGPLMDDSSDKASSIHDRCVAWGGDMVADDDGNLFILSARNTVFKVNIAARSASYLGKVSGLPRGFTTDGAVVTSEGKLLISSAINGNNYFLVDPANWKATPFRAKDGIFRSSDLANANSLQTQKPEILVNAESKTSDKVRIYPNPVAADHFKLQLRNIAEGNYTVQVVNLMGETVTQRIIKVKSENQVETIALGENVARGMYVVRINGIGKAPSFTQKLVLR